MSKEIREQIDRVKNWKQFLNEDFGAPDDDGNADDDGNVDTIEGDIEYDNFIFNYKVDVIDNLGFIDYSFDFITSNEVDEEYIDENWNDIKSAIIRDLSKGNFLSSKSSDTSIKYKYYVIDTRNGRTLGSHNKLIDRSAASEIYDIPKSFIEIKIVGR